MSDWLLMPHDKVLPYMVNGEKLCAALLWTFYLTLDGITVINVFCAIIYSLQYKALISSSNKAEEETS